MALTVTKAGPYFNGTNAPSNTTNMKFSQLRDTFRLNNPSGSITAGELLRDINTGSTDPIVPDCTENSGVAANPIAPNRDWKVSQLQGAIKFYYINQGTSDTHANWNISTLSEWNNNLGKTIKKWLYLRGNHTSTTTGDSGAKIVTDAWNLSLEVHGTIYGAGGSGGTSGSVSGTNGGNALSISGGRVAVQIQSSGRIWAGGGGGEFGADGSAGSRGTCYKDTTVQACQSTPSCPSGQTLTSTWGGSCCNVIRYCGGPWNSFCWHECWGNWTMGNCRQEADSNLPATVQGGNGGAGRGWNNQSGSLNGSAGPGGNCPTCSGGWYLASGTGSCSGQGGTGGSGGDWGTNGGNTGAAGSGGSAGDAIDGNGYTVTGNNSTTVRGSI